ncbi:cytokinin-o-glucosyltransferase 2 [Hordeum vulgare]|nr:cytokinin-o-glucosyltransferase 2 [Hordeum vulgare]
MVKKVFNIPSGNRTVEFYKRHEQCDLPNIYHKTGRAPTAHTVDVLYKARNDDVDTTKRSWVLLALATILTPHTGNMVPLECLKSLEKIDKVTEYAWDEHVLRIVMNEVKKCQEKIKSQDITKFWVGSCFPMLVLCGVQFRPLSDTPYVALPPEGRVTGIVVGNSSTTTQDVDCDDTQGCGGEDVNINGNQDEVAAEDNPIEDVNPMENGKSVEEDVFGSLDDWLENRVPFGVDPEVDERGGSKQSASTKAADEHAGSKQSASTKAADEHAGSKQTASTKAADEQITHKVMVEPVEGAQSICYSRSADETNGGNVVYLRTETSVDYNQDNAEKEQVSSGKDVSHGPQLGASVGGHWSDAPSMSLFQKGTKEWWIGVPSAPVDSNSSSPGNIAATPKSCAVFDATPQDPDSAGIKVHVYDVTPIAMAPFSSGTAGSPKP